MENSAERFGNNEQRPDVNSLLSGLKEYNDYFNMGAVLARGMIGHAHIEEDEEDSSDKKSETEQQEEKLAELKKKYRNVLETTGLSLEPVNSPFVIFGMETMNQGEIQKRIESFTEETGITGEDLNDPDSYEAKRANDFMDDLKAEASKPTRLTEMRLNVSNAEKFLSYLDSLKNSEMSFDEKEALESIAEILEKQFVGQYDVSNPDDDRFLVLIGSLEKIIMSYEELGLGKSVEELKNLLEISRKKYLKEYLVIKRKNYLHPHTEGFGPAKWHTDMTPDLYKARWKEAIEIYNQTASNPKAHELAKELKAHLLEAIDIAEKDIEARPRENEYGKKNYPQFLSTLELSRKDLSSAS